MNLHDWYALHSSQADEEGWSIFEAEYEIWHDPDPPPGVRGPFDIGGTSHIGLELQIQRLDDAEVFAGDDDAWTWVWTHRIPGTAAGDALAIIAEESPVEFARISAHAYGWPI